MKSQPVFRPANPPRPGVSNPENAVLAAIDRLLNKIFALNQYAARIRSMIVGVSFIVIWLLLSFTSLAREDYSILVNNLFQSVAEGNTQTALIEGGQAFFTIFLNMVVVRHLLALYVPFWLMQHVAAIYLADIFEKDENVAHRFIQQAVFAETYHTIHIRQGKVADEDQESPMIQIGGPGYVVVELDSAVLFEKPDGTSQVFGPTTQGGYNTAILEGFERIRQGVDLRDVIQKQDITARSRDGIPVNTKDVQYSYSIYRGTNPVKSPETPFPFDKKAVENLVYNSVRPVKLGEPPERKQDWVEPLPGKIFGQISGEMSNFISKRGLSDFLVTIGKPEDENLIERKKDTDDLIRAMAGLDFDIPDIHSSEFPNSKDDNAQAILNKPRSQQNEINHNKTPEFISRSLLTKMYYDNSQDKAEQRGIHLNWIGVGNWITPTQIIPRKHLEAWKISCENLARGNPGELQRIFTEARQHEFLRLIEDVPIRKLVTELQDIEPDKQIIGILKEYLLVLEKARELYRPNIPAEILKAIREIERWIYPNEYHSVGEES